MINYQCDANINNKQCKSLDTQQYYYRHLCYFHLKELTNDGKDLFLPEYKLNWR